MSLANNVKKRVSRFDLQNEAALELWGKGAAFLIILAVAVFAEVVYLGTINKMFPSNPLFQFACIMGGTATGASVMILLVGKLKWIGAGSQSIASWLFFAVEMFVMALNLMISFQLANGQTLDPWFAAYYSIMPATPLFAAVGWTVILMTDKSKKRHDEKKELAEDLENAEMEHEREQHDVLMTLRRDILHIHTDKMRTEVERNIPHIERITSEIVANEVGALIGMYVPRVALPAPKQSVESTLQPASLAQTTSTPPLPPTHTLPGMNTSIPADALDPINEALSQAGYAGMNIHDLIATLDAAKKPSMPGMFDLPAVIALSGVPADHAAEFVIQKMQERKLPILAPEDVAAATGERTEDIMQWMTDAGLLTPPPTSGQPKNVKRRSGN